MKRGQQSNKFLPRITGEPFYAFVSHPLPPMPEIQWTSSLSDSSERANRAIGRLDGLSRLLPDLSLFLYYYVRKEAVLSSQIEGTQSSLSDLLLYESDEVPGAPLYDVKEVSNYVAALNFGMGRLAADAPLMLRLIREMHEVLLSHGRGADKQPGEFCRSQNLDWRFTPRQSRVCATTSNGTHDVP